MVRSMRIETGVFGLDDLLGGGYLPNTVNVVLGSTGTGKTTFALQYLMKGIEQGEKGIFVSFDMKESDIIETVSSLGWDEIQDYISEDRLTVNRFYVDRITYLNNDLFRFIHLSAEEKTRIVIDSFTPLVSSISFEDRENVNMFFSNLKKLGTTVVTLEEPLNGDLSNPSLVVPLFLSNSIVNIKNLGYGEAFNRTIRILKHRGSWHAEGVFPFRILNGFGIFVEGGKYACGQKNEVKIDEILKKHKITKKDMDGVLFRKISTLAESRVEKAEELISEVVEKVKVSKRVRH
jgi:KaiC/GvpD/RAD55 family RecA-like ATPase